MRIESRLLNNLDLENIASKEIKRWLDHFPPLITERCLEDSSQLLGRHISASFSQGANLLAEVLTMPRQGFGPRPILITTASARILYSALTASLDNTLAEATRGPSKWHNHKQFGLDGTKDYIIDLDIASYYEYVDHDILEKELVLRSMRANESRAIVEYLTEILGRPRGLPQMQRASDRLADTYLSILDRRLARDGYQLSRFVDDIRITADSWAVANEAIERTAEYLRDLGLILSSGKTGIYKKGTLIDQEREDAEFYNDRYRQMRDELSSLVFVDPYGELESVKIEPEAKQTALATTYSIMQEWWSFFKKKEPGDSPPRPLVQFLSTGLYALREYESRLPHLLIKDIGFHDPRKIEQIAGYVIARSKLYPNEPHLSSLEGLIIMGRQSPWAKLWLLYAIDQVYTGDKGLPIRIDSWVKQQLSDRHEIVRAQAVWLCAKLGDLTAEQLTYLYGNSSEITQPALAACVGRQGNLPNSVIKGIVADSPLNKAAFEWSQG